MQTLTSTALRATQCADHLRDRLEAMRRAHFEAEGAGSVNENPDGCYYCGSPHHHSSDCRESEASLDW